MSRLAVQFNPHVARFRTHLNAKTHGLAVDDANGSRAEKPGYALRTEKGNVVHHAVHERTERETGSVPIRPGIIKII